MTLFFIKGALLALPIYVIMGFLGNLIGVLMLNVFSKTKNDNINSFLKISIYVFFSIGALFFSVMGMFYASYTLLLYQYLSKWLATTLVVLYLILLSRFNSKEIRSLHTKTSNFSSYDFYQEGKYSKYCQFVGENLLLGGLVLLPSFIFFLYFNNLTEKLSFELNSFLLSFL